MQHFLRKVMSMLILIYMMPPSSRGEDCPRYGYYNITQFGNECQYRCRCVNEEQCERETGLCQNGCGPGWMGPGCQYRNIAVLSSNVAQNTTLGTNASVVIDSNSTTCSNSSTAEGQDTWWRVDFPKRYYIVGLILKLKTASIVAIRIEGSIDEFSSNDHVLCYHHTVAEIATELEIMCGEPMNVQQVRIVAPATSATLQVCEVEIYGGRYISYKGQTSQSSTFWGTSGAAVDGRPMLEGDDQETVAQRTCAVTHLYINQFWNIYFSKDMLLQGLYVYGRRLPQNPDYYRQSAGFFVHAEPKNGSYSLIYKDDPIGGSWREYQPRIIDLASPRRCQGVYIQQSSVNHLSLCEVEIFAECESHLCGWNCSDVCHCSTVSTGSYRMNGRCPYGCAHRWTGQHGRCDSTCENSSWGTNCSLNCYCFPGTQCNIDNGTCPGECALGWKGPSCNISCDSNMYGQNCNESCGKCRDNVLCNAFTGLCPGECEPGWQGSLCQQQCDDHFYGQGCNKSCGHCFASDTCNKVSGNCVGCNAGYEGDTCKTGCNDTSYGFNCNETCGQCKHNEACNATTGHCPGECEPGWLGVFCKEPCSNLTYGSRCSQSCGQCLHSAVCDKVGGHCISCEEGYKGLLCNDMCTNGTYGPDCKETCGSCKNNEVCNNINGTCPGDCEPGRQGFLCKEALSINGDNGSSTSIILIVGIIVGVLVFAAVVVGIIIFVRRRSTETTQRGSDSPDNDTHDCIRMNNTPAAEPGHTTVNDVNDDAEEHFENPLYLSNIKSSDLPTRMDPSIQGSDSPDNDTHEYIRMNNTPAAAEPGYTNVNDVNDDDEEHYINLLYLSNIKLSDLPTRMDPSILYEEFSQLPIGLQFDTEMAQRQSNVHKNRFRDLIPYDKNVVVIPPIPVIADSDYISASYINGYHKERRYIASQGPMKNTVSDLWRMVWSHNITTIIMLTSCNEHGKFVCEQYWPNDGSQQYGDITVKMQFEEDVYSDHCIRTFEIRKRGRPELKHTTQYQFTEWLDNDVPDDTLFLVHFWRIVKQSEKSADSPWMVHCSSGIGRTGTFIALDYLYDEGKSTDCVNVNKCVHDLRDQRVNMVQTKDQYVFLHRAVNAAFNAVGLSFRIEELAEKWDTLTCHEDTAGSDKLYQEFQTLSDETTSTKEESDYVIPDPFFTENDFSDSMEPENIGKSRNRAILPPNKYRPKLSVTNDDQNDYINAVLMSTFRKKGGLILNQLPLPDTVDDTLRLIWQFEISTVVIMEQTIQKGSKYWPNIPQQVFDAKTFTVHLVSVEFKHGNATRKITIKPKKSKNAREVTLLQCQKWPDSSRTPVDKTAVIRLITDAEILMRAAGSSGPLLVQCLDGATRSGLFSTLWSIIERIKSDNTVAVADTVRLARVRRKQIIPNYDQYRFCWEIAKEYTTNDTENYGNIM